jgi:hypothetical protein
MSTCFKPSALGGILSPVDSSVAAGVGDETSRRRERAPEAIVGYRRRECALVGKWSERTHFAGAFTRGWSKGTCAAVAVEETVRAAEETVVAIER